MATTNRLQKVVEILSQLSEKKRNAVLSVIDFDKYSASENYGRIIDKMMTVAKVSDRAILAVYKDMQPSDDEVMNAFDLDNAEELAPLYFNAEQLAYISENVYRNREGEFRLIPKARYCSAEQMPLEGLKADEDIIAAKLKMTRVGANGSTEEFDGLKELQKQPYEGPYDGCFLQLGKNLRRINIISSFASEDPHGFFERDGHLYRNVCSQMAVVNPDMVTPIGLRRAMFLMFIVAGGSLKDWESLYNLVHFMVKVPNSSTGYALYLNDFDAGGNGKSKFISLLGKMFGDSFTAFSTQQLRFTMSLLGKRLVSISEYEDSSSAKELQALIKSMTGRDRFQYEAKGVDPIVADTFQNFVISSNRYINFDDSGMKRRLQNFHCSNLLHIMQKRYTHNQEFLNPLFGNVCTGESVNVQKEMANSLLDHIIKDDVQNPIPIREQDIVLGNLKNPILRNLFRENVNLQRFTEKAPDGRTVLQLLAVLENQTREPDPAQLNYAASALVSWFPEIQFEIGRSDSSLTTKMSQSELETAFKARLAELDARAKELRGKVIAKLEKCEFRGFSSVALFDEFIRPACTEYNIPVDDSGDFIIVGSE